MQSKQSDVINLAEVIASLDFEDRQPTVDYWLDHCMEQIQRLPRRSAERLYWRTTMEILEMAFEEQNWRIVDSLISGLEEEAKR
jgi:hypothetical protein